MKLLRHHENAPGAPQATLTDELLSGQVFGCPVARTIEIYFGERKAWSARLNQHLWYTRGCISSLPHNELILKIK